MGYREGAEGSSTDLSAPILDGIKHSKAGKTVAWCANFRYVCGLLKCIVEEVIYLRLCGQYQKVSAKNDKL